MKRQIDECIDIMLMIWRVPNGNPKIDTLNNEVQKRLLEIQESLGYERHIENPEFQRQLEEEIKEMEAECERSERI